MQDWTRTGKQGIATMLEVSQLVYRASTWHVWCKCYNCHHFLPPAFSRSALAACLPRSSKNPPESCSRQGVRLALEVPKIR